MIPDINTNQDIIILCILGVVAIAAFYFLSKRLKDGIGIVKDFIKWVKPSFEGENGTASSRRLSAFTVLTVYVSCRVLYARGVTDPYYLLLAQIVDALFILLLFGIVTFQQVITLKEGLKLKGPMGQIGQQVKEETTTVTTQTSSSIENKAAKPTQPLPPKNEEKKVDKIDNPDAIDNPDEE